MMQSLWTFWKSLDAPIRNFIFKFYVVYLGSLYTALFVLAVFLSVKRHPFLDWYAQGDLVPYFKLALFMMVVGFCSVFVGFFRLLIQTKKVVLRERLLVLGGVLTLPLMMYFAAVLCGPIVVFAFR